MSDSLQTLGLQHARLPYPSPSPGVYSNLCPSSRWCHPTISSSVIPFSSHLQSFPASGSFEWVRSLHQVSKVLEFQISTSVLQMNTQDWFPFWIDWFDLLAVQGTLKSLPQHHSSKSSFLLCSAFFIVQLSHLYMTTGETIALTTWTFVGKVMSLLFSILSRLVTDFLPRNNFFFFNFMAAVTLCSDLEHHPPSKKSLTVSIASPCICHEVMGPDALILFFECWVLSQLFHSPLSLSSFIIVSFNKIWNYKN